MSHRGSTCLQSFKAKGSPLIVAEAQFECCDICHLVGHNVPDLIVPDGMASPKKEQLNA